MKERVQWVDVAKGFGIVMVVSMHATLGVEKAFDAETALHAWVAFAQPFRMPDFFLISGLFLHRAMKWPLRRFMDRKFVHFAYFYLLWCALQLGSKFLLLGERTITDLARTLALGLVEPFGTLWFIFVLSLSFVAVRCAGGLPRTALLGIAIALNLLHPETGWTAVDEFCARFVYVVVGHLAGPWIVERARRVGSARRGGVLLALSFWAVANEAAVLAGIAEDRGMALILGVSGAAAVVSLAVLFERTPIASAFTYLGERSLVVYLAFFGPMAGVRVAALAIGVTGNPTAVAVASTAAGVLLPLLLYSASLRGSLKWLFRRPSWARLGGEGRRDERGITVPPAASR